MSHRSPGRPVRAWSLLAIFQVLFLLSALVLPVGVLAQEGDGGAGEPAPSAEPAPDQGGGEGGGGGQGGGGSEPEPEPQPQPEPEPTPVPRELFIDSDPRRLDLVVGETAKLDAYLCRPPAEGGSPFGEDKDPA